jgi:hypothetical protein
VVASVDLESREALPPTATFGFLDATDGVTETRSVQVDDDRS